MAAFHRDRTITGIFHDRDDAERAFKALIERGLTRDEISIVMSKDTRDRYYSGEHRETEVGTKAAEGAGVGGAIGGTLGGILGAITAAAAPVVFPGIGLVLAGPLAAALAGAGAGGLGGSLIGALIGAGIPEERVKHYEEGLKRGGIVVAVHPRNEAEAEIADEVLRHHHGEHVY